MNYETRKRDQKLQTHRTYALEQIEKLQEGLKHLYKNQEALILHSKDSELHQVSTTIARELVYCLDHAVHHQALIKIGLRELDLDHLVPDYFGVAYSTLRYRSSLAKSSDK